MDNSVNLKNIVKHLVNGTFEENFCRICLSALAGDCENIFTTLCQEDDEFCVADVLYKMCEIEVLPTDRCNVCSKCFTAASMAYKLFTLAKQSDQVLNYYVDELQRNVDSVDLATDITTHSICVTLPKVDITTQPQFHYGGILDTNYVTADAFNKAIKLERPVDSDENIVLVVKEKGERLFYRVQTDGTWKRIDNPDKSLLKKIKTESGVDEKPKLRRIRQPMLFKPCSRCPVKYRFIAKLKEHMKCEHDITLYVCTVCQAFMESEMDYENHIKTHTDVHVCALCNTMFRRRESIITHLKWHESMEKMSLQEGARICEVCGMIFPNEAELKDHYTKRHDKKYTCYYCGRMYKAEVGFELHIKKHEKLLSSSEPVPAAPRVRHPCSVCGRDFGDARSLTWHQRLHTNERPFTCDTCGRGFVSLNRRNQHAVCAHQAPARQCPLCPALFHFRSMVNTHIKKVHLRPHVRRARGPRRPAAAWRTARVPVPDLAVDIQASVLEIQAGS